MSFQHQGLEKAEKKVTILKIDFYYNNHEHEISHFNKSLVKYDCPGVNQCRKGEA